MDDNDNNSDNKDRNDGEYYDNSIANDDITFWIGDDKYANEHAVVDENDDDNNGYDDYVDDFNVGDDALDEDVSDDIVINVKNKNAVLADHAVMMISMIMTMAEIALMTIIRMIVTVPNDDHYDCNAMMKTTLTLLMMRMLIMMFTMRMTIMMTMMMTMITIIWMLAMIVMTISQQCCFDHC